MNELEELLKAEPFVAFVVTDVSGYSIPVPAANRALLGVNMLVVTDDSGYLHYLPLDGIARLTEYNPGGKGKTHKKLSKEESEANERYNLEQIEALGKKDEKHSKKSG